MYHYEDRENLVARNYAYYLRNVRNLRYEVDGTIDEVSYNIDLNNQVQEYHSIESFQSLGIMDPAFHLVYNVGNHICIYNMNYLSSDYINGYIKTYIDYKPSSTQMKKQILPYDVLEVPLNLVDQYIIEDGKIIKYIPRDSKLITEELKVLPLINEEVPNDPNSRLEWNYRNFTISKDKDIIDAQITHGGHNVDTIELSYDEMVILANAELIAG
jgi:hypothetical protein